MYTTRVLCNLFKCTPLTVPGTCVPPGTGTQYGTHVMYVCVTRVLYQMYHVPHVPGTTFDEIMKTWRREDYYTTLVHVMYRRSWEISIAIFDLFLACAQAILRSIYYIIYSS